jgi:hypothetical protein
LRVAGAERKIYAGARFNDGTPLYSGYEPGSELGWAMMAAGPEPLSINDAVNFICAAPSE